VDVFGLFFRFKPSVVVDDRKSRARCIFFIYLRIADISDTGIMELNLPTGIPFVYELDENMKPVVSMKFLGDPETVKKAMAAVAAQGKSK